MRYSSFYWAHRRRRGWIFGPWFGRVLAITLADVRGRRVVEDSDRLGYYLKEQ